LFAGTVHQLPLSSLRDYNAKDYVTRGNLYFIKSKYICDIPKMTFKRPRCPDTAGGKRFSIEIVRQERGGERIPFE
jgi:hypothetical protein